MFLSQIHVRGLSEKFVDTCGLDFKYDRFQFLIVHLCEAIYYKYLDQRYQQNGSNICKDIYDYGGKSP